MPGDGVHSVDVEVGQAFEAGESGLADAAALAAVVDLGGQRDLGEVAQVGASLSARTWVTEARRRGLWWDRIDDALGMKRQSDWERFAYWRRARPASAALTAPQQATVPGATYQIQPDRSALNVPLQP